MVVPRALQGIYARLVDGVRLFRRSIEHVISVRRAVAHAAYSGVAMVRRLDASIFPGPAGLLLHYMVVARAKRSQMAAQIACGNDIHKSSPLQIREIRSEGIPLKRK
jgi:hypothetical protein